MENKNSNVKFIPPKSFVHLDFWFKFADVKLNVDKLSDAPRHLFASINSTSSTQPVIEIDCTGFNSQPTDKMGMFPCHGILINKNTKEEFINTNKSKLLTDVSNHYYAQLFSKKTLENSSELVFFILFSFADLKTHKYLYWFAFPVFRDVFFKKGQTYTLLSSKFQRDKLFSFELQFKMFLEKSNELFFVYNSKESRFYRLSEIINHEDLSKNLKSVDLNYTFFCCTDLCFDKDPSWLLRQFLGYIAMSCPQITQKTINCICLKNNVASSIVFTLEIQSTDLNLEKPLWVGWETNNGRLIPRSVDMSKIMDPLKMVEKSINLNLTLMKWRLVPNLNLDIISTTKYLLLGAGTLGCGVARSLLMVITVALGFDTFLVIRHGSKSENRVKPNLIKGFKEIPGTYLGCYFCNDIVAPGNSMKDRTLDQQCTVTRPAVSYIASSLAVELTISLLQHKHRMYSKSLTMRKIPLYMKFLNLRKFWKK
uniref:Ubiquitin-like modifier-activating enzyme ATG7 n=1 Tax=Culex pipiens TaxID=7175 RepID=A0A8D8MEW5_CULPI